MIKVIASLLTLLVITIGARSQSIRSLDPSAFAAAINADSIQLLDVRTLTEYNSGHIRGAMLADWTKPDEFQERSRHFDKSRPIYVYCASGGRSQQAAAFLQKRGFLQVFELKKGFIEWKKANMHYDEVSAAKQLSREQFITSIKDEEGILVNLTAEWCLPCQKMKPVVAALEQNGVKILKIDAGSQTELLNALKVSEIPTFIYFKKGSEAARLSGLNSLEELTSVIK